MTISNALIHEVSAKIRGRGQQYFAGGVVTIVEGSAWSVHAVVRGSDQYQVQVFRDDPAFRASCTCPYYEDRFEPCKHIWAVLLAADAGGHLGGVRGTPPPDAFLDPIELDVPFEDDEDWREMPRPTATPRRTPAVASLSKSPQIARDTVEERVLELQAAKRRLADSVIRADESLVRHLEREDLERLLS